MIVCPLPISNIYVFTNPSSYEINASVLKALSFLC